tara:strand:- start:158 stop:337 length:180 start_codon:yes stop_codon:yes gene_type:complete
MIDSDIILLLLFIFYGVPLITSLIALFLWRKKPKTAKITLIITAIYILISLGYCGILGI